MTAQVPTPLRTGRSAPRTVRPKQITVARHDIVGRRMNYIAHTRDALTAAGYAHQLVARLGLDPISAEALRAITDTRKPLVALLTALLAEAGCLDGLCDDPDHRHPGHGRGA